MTLKNVQAKLGKFFLNAVTMRSQDSSASNNCDDDYDDDDNDDDNDDDDYDYDDADDDDYDDDYDDNRFTLHSVHTRYSSTCYVYY